MPYGSNNIAYEHGHDDEPKLKDQASRNLEDKSKSALEYIEDVTMNADSAQRRVLSEILTQNANVEYLQNYGLGSCEADRETFKKVPVITYEDLRPYVQRIANGDTAPILCSQPIVEFLASTGTSGGESKLYPITSEEQVRRLTLFGLIPPVVSQHVVDLEKGKWMYFQFLKPEMTTAGGLFARTLLTSFVKSKHFNPSIQYTSPKEAILCPEPSQSMYAQMLCGLYQIREVVWLGAPFALGFIHALRFLEKHWKLLCHDIRTGSINPIVTDTNVREAVMEILKPDPTLADFLESECSKESWEGIVARLCPNAKFVYSVVTGAMAQYIPTLDYYSNGLPIVSALYVSSECSFGLNLSPCCKPSDVAYTIIPTMAYFEFLPVNYDGKELREGLVDLVDVKLDHEYEIVVTTYSGLYRYRVGDILRVTGFKNKAPQFQFVSRKNVVLSIDFDKTEEAELQNAVTNAVNHLTRLDASLLDYTSYADISTIPGHYVLFWEIVNRNNIRDNVAQMIPSSVLEDCCLVMEESLGSVYRELRTFGKIGALEIRVVENGTFDKLMEYATTKGAASLSQYKTPRSVKDAAMIELLNSKVISRYLSPKCPKWAPVLGIGFTKEEQD